MIPAALCPRHVISIFAFKRPEAGDLFAMGGVTPLVVEQRDPWATSVLPRTPVSQVRQVNAAVFRGPPGRMMRSVSADVVCPVRMADEFRHLDALGYDTHDPWTCPFAGQGQRERGAEILGQNMRPRQ